MSIEKFNAVIQSHVFKQWLEELDKNILKYSADVLRKTEQAAAKTDFLLTTKDLQSVYSSITGSKLSGRYANRLLEKIKQLNSKRNISDTVVKVGANKALLFENIAFSDISKVVREVLDELPEIQAGYAKYQENYRQREYAKVNANAELTQEQKAQELERIDYYSKKKTLGMFVHKGHVLSIATNSAKNFREQLASTYNSPESDDTEKVKAEILLPVLDAYIAKLEEEDLATSNLAGRTISTAVYANYIKNSGRYLVELQLAINNLSSGGSSSKTVNELRQVFLGSAESVAGILRNSPALGQALVKTESSPSMLQLMAMDLLAIFSGKKPKKSYKSPGKIKVAERKQPVTVKSNKAEIDKLKDLKGKLKTTKAKTKLSSSAPPPSRDAHLNLFSLKAFIDAHLQDVISANMGDGSRRDILNYRTGRFASTVEVQRLTESKQGMITAFYTYMKNPYGTFSDGGLQQYPKTRDPKLLISKSIREIVAERVGNKLRAVAL